MPRGDYVQNTRRRMRLYVRAGAALRLPMVPSETARALAAFPNTRMAARFAVFDPVGVLPVSIEHGVVISVVARYLGGSHAPATKDAIDHIHAGAAASARLSARALGGRLVDGVGAASGDAPVALARDREHWLQHLRAVVTTAGASGTAAVVHVAPVASAQAATELERFRLVVVSRRVRSARLLTARDAARHALGGASLDYAFGSRGRPASGGTRRAASYAAAARKGLLVGDDAAELFDDADMAVWLTGLRYMLFHADVVFLVEALAALLLPRAYMRRSLLTALVDADRVAHMMRMWAAALATQTMDATSAYLVSWCAKIARLALHTRDTGRLADAGVDDSIAHDDARVIRHVASVAFMRSLVLVRFYPTWLRSAADWYDAYYAPKKAMRLAGLPHVTRVAAGAPWKPAQRDVGLDEAFAWVFREARDKFADGAVARASRAWSMRANAMGEHAALLHVNASKGRTGGETMVLPAYYFGAGRDDRRALLVVTSATQHRAIRNIASRAIRDLRIVDQSGRAADELIGVRPVYTDGIAFVVFEVAIARLFEIMVLRRSWS